MYMPRQLWIPQVLRDAGLTVYEEKGWETRGTTTFNPIGVMWHHTASPATWSSRQLTNLLVKGHSTLRGPLCQLQLNRDGVYVVIAAGRANHAGTGSWPTISAGNTQTIGIEAANDGVGEPWPKEQVDAYIIGTAALLKHMDQPVENVVGHKEWAPRRKIDPRGLDMDEMRSRVHSAIKSPNTSSGLPDLPPGLNWGQGGLPKINAPSPSPSTPTPSVNIGNNCKRQVLRRGARGPCVKSLQRALNVLGHNAGAPDGVFGSRTDAAVKSFQRFSMITVDGVVGPQTWSKF